MGFGSGPDQDVMSMETNDCNLEIEKDVAKNSEDVPMKSTTDNDGANVSQLVAIKEEAETSADSLTIDVEGGHDLEDTTETKLKTEALDPMEQKAWINALRTHIVVPLVRHPKSISFRRPVDPVALGIYPIYNQIIKQPMDLSTIKQNIDQGSYVDKDDLIRDIKLVWNNAKTFNPKGHFVYEAADFMEKFVTERLEKIKRDGPNSISRPTAPLPPPREGSKRDARKRSLDLPGETRLPQHLEQNRHATGSMRACENLLRNLMTQKIHREYVEPFIEVVRKVDTELYDPMSLSKIQTRLKNNAYNHPMAFADDVRRIVTETYRYNSPMDPLVELAGKLQSEFEMLFAKIEFQENEIMPTVYSGLSEDDRFISKLFAAQNFMVNIQSEVTSLIKDYIYIKNKDAKRREKRRKQMRPSVPSTSNPPAYVSGVKRKQMSSNNPPAKRSKPAASKKPKLEGMLMTKKNNLSLQEGNALREQVAGLNGNQQMTVINILTENGEKLVTDDEGSIEMEFREFSQKSIDDLKAYVQSVTNIAAKNRPQAGSFSGKNIDNMVASDDGSSSSDSSSSDSDSD